MRPRARPDFIPPGPFKCRFCPAVLRDKTAPEAKAWDWVTGYLPATEHCCPACLKANATMWAEIRRRAAMAAPATSGGGNG